MEKDRDVWGFPLVEGRRCREARGTTPTQAEGCHSAEGTRYVIETKTEKVQVLLTCQSAEGTRWSVRSEWQALYTKPNQIM